MVSSCSDNYDPVTIQRVTIPSPNLNQDEDESAVDFDEVKGTGNSGLVTDQECLEKGTPIYSLVDVRDKIRQTLSQSLTCGDAAHSVALFCLKPLRFTNCSLLSVSPKSTQDLNLRRLEANLPVVITLTIGNNLSMKLVKGIRFIWRR